MLDNKKRKFTNHILNIYFLVTSSVCKQYECFHKSFLDTAILSVHDAGLLIHQVKLHLGSHLAYFKIID